MVMSSSSCLTEVSRPSGGCWRLNSDDVVAGEQSLELSRRHGTGEQEALNALAVERTQRVELLIGLDALCGHRAAERPRHGDQRGHDRLIANIIGKTAHETAIDLERAHRVLLEPGQRGDARAEVVEHDADAVGLDTRLACVCSISIDSQDG